MKLPQLIAYIKTKFLCEFTMCCFHCNGGISRTNMRTLDKAGSKLLFHFADRQRQRVLFRGNSGNLFSLDQI